VTAQNTAGSASQTSAPVAVFKIGKARLNKRRGTARLPVEVPGSGELTLAGKGVVKQRFARRSQASGERARKVGGAGTVRLLVKAKAKRKKKLNQNGRVKLKVEVTFTATGETPGSQAKKIKLKKAIRR
jgi:hypothetical protein